MFDQLTKTLENYQSVAAVSPATGRKRTRPMQQHSAAVWYSPRDEQASQLANSLFLQKLAERAYRNQYVVIAWRIADDKIAIFESLRECAFALKIYQPHEVRNRAFNPHSTVDGYQMALYFPGMSLDRPTVIEQSHRPTMWLKATNLTTGKVILNPNLLRLAQLTTLPQSNVHVALACRAVVRGDNGDWSFCAATIEDLLEHKPDYFPEDYTASVAACSDYNRALRTRRFAFSEADREPHDSHPSVTWVRVVKAITGRSISRV